MRELVVDFDLPFATDREEPAERLEPVERLDPAERFELAERRDVERLASERLALLRVAGARLCFGAVRRAGREGGGRRLPALLR